MLDLCIDQGVGLRHIGMNASTRVIAVTSHGDHESEMPLLWNLCSALVELGFGVTVLDGTINEPTDETGLAEILDTQYWQTDVKACHDTWSVLPAAIGLRKICEASPDNTIPLVALEGLFESGQVVVVYAGSDLLCQLLAKSDIQPLLAVTYSPSSLMTAYRALKQMHLTTRIHPMIVTVSLEDASPPPANSAKPGEILHQCARNFLTCDLRSPGVATLNLGDKLSPDICKLTTQMLETSMPLEHHSNAPPEYRWTRPRALFQGSH
jgi:hypothetical protein